MLVLILEKVPPSMRGELSRWLLEVKVGVFVGKVSALVREELWKTLTDKLKQGSAMLIYPMNNEQGFSIHTLGDTSKVVEDIEGLLLIKTHT
jgi:CRISPR-associated protein Cas2